MKFLNCFYGGRVNDLRGEKILCDMSKNISILYRSKLFCFCAHKIGNNVTEDKFNYVNNANARCSLLAPCIIHAG